MKKCENRVYYINSIPELHKIMGLSAPRHPWVSVMDLALMRQYFPDNLVCNFYKIVVSTHLHVPTCGQNCCETEGEMVLALPGWSSCREIFAHRDPSGAVLLIHPDFIRCNSPGRTIKCYDFLSLSKPETLPLTGVEELIVTEIIKNIEWEYSVQNNDHNQNIIISSIDLLLNYYDRFYCRKFSTSLMSKNDLILKLEFLLSDYFNSQKVAEWGPPTVKYVAKELHISPNYLSEKLRKLTGQSAQHYIHNVLIEKAKDILLTTSLSISEIAYRFGFSHSQAFCKLFKNKTNTTPLSFRQSFSWEGRAIA